MKKMLHRYMLYIAMLGCIVTTVMNASEISEFVTLSFNNLIPASKNVFNQPISRETQEAWNAAIKSIDTNVKKSAAQSKFVSTSNLDLFATTIKAIQQISDEIVRDIATMREHPNVASNRLSNQLTSIKKLKRDLEPKLLDVPTTKSIKEDLTFVLTVLEKGISKISNDYMAWHSHQQAEFDKSLPTDPFERASAFPEPTTVSESYRFFNIDSSSSWNDVDRKHKNLSMKLHPDRNMDRKELANANFKKLGVAYDILKKKYGK